MPTLSRRFRWTVALLAIAATTAARAQPVTIIIPSLANASQPKDLDYQAGECEVNAAGTSMDCTFQQVFLTVALFDAETCLITTNRYSRTFQKAAENRWISREGPSDECGLVSVATLENAGGTRWSLAMTSTVTDKSSVACRSRPDTTETLTWQDQRRPLPCRYVQPGYMSR